MLFFAASINYLDRQVLGLLAPTLQHSIGWTEAQYGYIVGAFQFAYAIGLILAGRLVDKLGTRIGYAIIMAFWSVASMAHALASRRNQNDRGMVPTARTLSRHRHFQFRNEYRRDICARFDSLDHTKIRVARRFSGDRSLRRNLDRLVGRAISQSRKIFARQSL
jgi:hypothetical protein